MVSKRLSNLICKLQPYSINSMLGVIFNQVCVFLSYFFFFFFFFFFVSFNCFVTCWFVKAWREYEFVLKVNLGGIRS